MAGVTIVAAAGNVVTLNDLIYGCPVAYPAAYPEAIAVTYTGQNDALTGYSCTGTQVDIAAPGDQIFSPVPIGPCQNCSTNGYLALSGTSMASPHVAGAVALVLSKGIADANHDGLLSDDVKAHLCATARTASSPAKTDPRYPKWYGCGIVNVQDALLTNPPPPPDNGAPIAAADSATTAEDTQVDVPVLANDSDPNGDPLTVTARAPRARQHRRRNRMARSATHRRGLRRPGFVRLHGRRRRRPHGGRDRQRDRHAGQRRSRGDR